MEKNKFRNFSMKCPAVEIFFSKGFYTKKRFYCKSFLLNSEGALQRERPC